MEEPTQQGQALVHTDPKSIINSQGYAEKEAVSNLWAEEKEIPAGPSLQQVFESFGTSLIGSVTRSSGLTRLFGESLGEKTFSSQLREAAEALAAHKAAGGMLEAKSPVTKQLLPPAATAQQVWQPTAALSPPALSSAAVGRQNLKRDNSSLNNPGSSTSSENGDEDRSSSRSCKARGDAPSHLPWGQLGGLDRGGVWLGGSKLELSMGHNHESEMGKGARSPTTTATTGMDDKSLDIRQKNMLKSRRHRQRKKEQEAMLNERISQLEGELKAAHTELARVLLEARTERARLEAEKDHFRAELARVGVVKADPLVALPALPQGDVIGDPQGELERLRVENSTLREGYRNMLETMTKLLQVRKELPAAR